MPTPEQHRNPCARQNSIVGYSIEKQTYHYHYYYTILVATRLLTLLALPAVADQT